MTEYSPHLAVPAPRAAPPPLLQPGPSNAGSLAGIIARIEETIDAETAALRSDPNFDIAASNARKSRALYELTRALKIEGGPRREHQPAILRLQGKLAANEQAVRAHMSAVSEVAQLIQAAIQHAETDGTYGSQAFGGA